MVSLFILEIPVLPNPSLVALHLYSYRVNFTEQLLAFQINCIMSHTLLHHAPYSFFLLPGSFAHFLIFLGFNVQF